MNWGDLARGLFLGIAGGTFILALWVIVSVSHGW